MALPRHARAPDRGRDGRSVARGRAHRNRARRDRRPRQGRLARCARRCGSACATKARFISASGSPSRRSRSTTRRLCTSAAASATTSYASATSRRSWTGRSGRRPRSCSTAAASRSRARTSSPRSSAAVRARGCRLPCTRSATSRTDEALDAFEETRDAVAAARPAPADRARPAALSGGHPALRPTRRRRLRPIQPRSVRRRRSRSASGRERPTAPTRTARSRTRARCSPTARTRRSRSWTPGPGSLQAVSRVWHQEQRLTLDEALQATTVNPAWLARDEHRRGKLLPGYLADLVVLDRDPYEAAPEELAEIQVVATMLGGRWVHNSPPWD